MLDTNICIYIIKQRPETVLKRFASHPVGDIGVSVIALSRAGIRGQQERQSGQES